MGYQNGGRPKCSSAKRQTTKMLVRKYPFFWYESSSWIKLRLHTETQLPRYLWSGLDIGLGFGLSKRRTTKMLIRKTADDQNARPQNGGWPKCSSAKWRTNKMIQKKLPKKKISGCSKSSFQGRNESNDPKEALKLPRKLLLDQKLSQKKIPEWSKRSFQGRDSHNDSGEAFEEKISE